VRRASVVWCWAVLEELLAGGKQHVRRVSRSASAQHDCGSRGRVRSDDDRSLWRSTSRLPGRCRPPTWRRHPRRTCSRSWTGCWRRHPRPLGQREARLLGTHVCRSRCKQETFQHEDRRCKRCWSCELVLEQALEASATAPGGESFFAVVPCTVGANTFATPCEARAGSTILSHDPAEPGDCPRGCEPGCRVHETFKPQLDAIKDKYYEMFRNQSGKETRV